MASAVRYQLRRVERLRRLEADDLGDKEEARGAIELAVGGSNQEPLTGYALARAIRLGPRLGLAADNLAKSPSVLRLGPDNWTELLDTLEESRKEFAVVHLMITERMLGLAEEKKQPPQDTLLFHLGLAHISNGDLHSAVTTFRSIVERSKEGEAAPLFNLAMALYWTDQHAEALTGFKRLETYEKTLRYDDANYIQCVAFTKFVLGNVDAARRLLQRALQQVRRVPRKTFSCWSYLKVTPRQFETDIRRMDEWFCGAQVLPPFVRGKPVTAESTYD